MVPFSYQKVLSMILSMAGKWVFNGVLLHGDMLDFAEQVEG